MCVFSWKIPSIVHVHHGCFLPYDVLHFMQCCHYLLYTCFVGGGIDYEDPTPDTLVFVQNLASTSFPFVPICDNVTGEGNENVQLTIFVPPQYQHYVATQQPSTTTVIIIGKQHTIQCNIILRNYANNGCVPT